MAQDTICTPESKDSASSLTTLVIPNLPADAAIPSAAQSAGGAKAVTEGQKSSDMDEKQDFKTSEVPHKEGSDSGNSLADLSEKDLEDLKIPCEITILPYSKLVPLMFGLCAGMLLSSMDSVSEF